jgi:hypothetical protein
MNMDVPPLGAAERPTTAQPVGKTGSSGAAFEAPGTGEIPASPPPHVLREVEAAARRAQWLREHGRELHFELDDGKLRVEVRDLNGRVVRVVPATEALEIATGGPLG